MEKNKRDFIHFPCLNTVHFTVEYNIKKVIFQ